MRNWNYFKTRVLSLSTAVALATVTLYSPLVAQEQPRLAKISNDFRSVAKTSIPAVVSIKVKAPSKSSYWNEEEDPFSGFGDHFWKRFFGGSDSSSKGKHPTTIGQASGFIVSRDGYILTNSHVVNEATEILVTLTDGREFSGKLMGQDPNTDIALVKIDADNLPFVQLGNSDQLEVGEWVIAIGNPLGLQASLTAGVVSAVGRNNLDLARVEDFIQTDAAINQGNSGGPLLDLDGQVMGMNTAIATNMSSGYMGIGFAIPSNLLKNIMGQILKNGSVTRGYIGVTLQKVDNDLAHAFGLEKAEGALIADVAKDSPAQKAGIKRGDIVLKYNGTNVANIAALRNYVALMTPGTTVKLSVLRDGKKLEVPVQVGNFPSNVQMAAASQDANKLGFEVANLTPENAQSLGHTDEQGVVITKVYPESPAGWAGIKKGTLLLAINQNKITNLDDFHAAVKNLSFDKPTLLLIKQGDFVRYVSFKLPSR